MFRLFQSLFGRVQTRRRSVRPTRRECHLTLETLEDRCVPADNSYFRSFEPEPPGAKKEK